MLKRFVVSLLFLCAAIHQRNANAEVALTIETATKAQFNSQPGKMYQVYMTTNLDRTGWSAIGSPQIGSGEVITFFHTTTGDQRAFFKVEASDGAPAASPGGTPLSLLRRARLNLQGQNLSGLTATNLDLNNFSFTGANLENADLSGSIFTDASLSGANFSQAKLVGADLNHATGSSVIFSGADLRNASLGGQSGNFDQANLAGAKILGPYTTGGTFNGAIARGLVATNVVINFTQTSGADFTGADFSGASVSSFSSFAGANLTGAKFINTIFSFEPSPRVTPVHFDNANLTDADLTGATNFFDAFGVIYKNTKMPDGSIRSNP
jgi:uncharacterized protein YjbI with pentapeptide repeats